MKPPLEKMEGPKPLRRTGFAGRWTPGTDQLAAGFCAAWPPGEAPAILGIANLADVPHFAETCDSWVLLHGDCLPWMDVLRRGGKPAAARSVEYDAFNIPLALTEDEEAGRRAAELLAATCAGELVYMGIPQTFSRRRGAGFAAGCREAGRTARLLLQDEVDPSAWLPTLPEGSGIFAFNDACGYRLEAAARALGIPVLESLSIVGVDNAPLPEVGRHRPLTTMAFSMVEQGRVLGLLLRTHAEGRSPARRTGIPPGPLLHRSTTRPLPDERRKDTGAIDRVQQEAGIR